jgi:hypothetical protein
MRRRPAHRRKFGIPLLTSVALLVITAACSPGSASPAAATAVTAPATLAAATAAPTQPPSATSTALGSGNATATATAQATQAPSPGATMEVSCENVYLPVVEGATWNYTTDISGIGSGTSTATITDVGTSGFLREVKTKRITSVETWNCTESGLVKFESDGGLFSFVVQGANGTATLKPLSVTGVTIPASFEAGDTWSQVTQFEVQGTNTAGTATMTYHFAAAGPEQVAVPAGTFDAMRIEVTATSDWVLNAVTTNINYTGTDWWVPEVGLAKRQGVVSVMGSTTTFDYQAVLDTYKIP